MSSWKRVWMLPVAVAALACGAVGAAYANPGGGGGHVGGGAHFGGGGHFAGGPHGYYGGYRGGYGRGYYGGWGWGGFGWGLGYGLFFASLPWYYDTYWWNGVPYYYGDNTYYTWNPGVGQYETVPPPAGLDAPQTGAPQGGATGGSDLFMYPKSGQTAEQQARDRYECHRWAVGQSGFDPTPAGAPAPGAAPADGAGAPAGAGAAAANGSPQKRMDYRRAQIACLEGRNYSVK